MMRREQGEPEQTKLQDDEDEDEERERRRNNDARLPRGTAYGSYRIRAPLIKPSKIYEMGGWVINFAIGCTFGCRFCYVDQIQKKFGARLAGDIVFNDWGNYFAVPSNLQEAIDQTDWERWRGKNVMMSSTHDAYLPSLAPWAREIVLKALTAGVNVNILTRSPLVERDFEIFSRYRTRVSVRVSAFTMDKRLARATEPRVVFTTRRLEILSNAKRWGLRTGVHVGPIFPPNELRRDVSGDLDALVSEIARVAPDHISGESLHARGPNLRYLQEATGGGMELGGFDGAAREMFLAALRSHGLAGEWSS